MNNVKKGLKIFNCSTDYDYYLLQNKDVYKKTIINDYNDIITEYLINSELKFIPNHSFDEIFNLINNNDNNNGFINDQSSYEPRKKWMSKNKDNEYKYPCIYSINNKNVIDL